MSQHLLDRGRRLGRTARVAAVAALALATTVGTAGTASAESPEEHPIEIHVDKAGITAPQKHLGGLVSFRVKTDDPAGRQLQLLRPHAGVSIDRVLHDLARSVSRVRGTAAAGMRAVHGEAEALGGAMVTPQVHEQFTEEVDPGSVYLLDLTAFRADPAHPVVRTLELAGTNGMSANQARYPHGIVIHRATSDGPRFQTDDLDHVHLAYLVHNGSSQIHETRLRPVAPGTTDAQVQKYLDAVAAGRKAASPFTGPPTGLGAFSPDRSASIQAHGLQPGRYAVLDLVPDEKTGLPHAALGMHQVVDLK
ncbi:hypothetical protein ACFC1R_32900 [Kitasatospora sp. NPDC056138]|uniref:hypothetical protein n=1 Tax=Kitasatospora sp. NPDC056138 TaxID=3345724 RepID=UPI0035E21B45